MSRHWLAVLIACVVGFVAGRAEANPSPDREADLSRMRCVGGPRIDLDLQIAGCTSLIQSGQENDQILGITFNNRGYAYDQKGEHDRAIADYDQAIRLQPKFAGAFNNRGNVYDQKGEHDRAIADYDQAIRLQPDFADAFEGRGNAYDQKGEHDRAIADYDQAIRLKPDFAFAFQGRGNAYDQKGEHDRAIADYDHAIRLQPDSADAFKARGYAFYQKGEYDRAVADYDQAIRLKPDLAFAFFGRGLAYNDKGEYERAIADYDQAIRLQPDFADAFRNRGRAKFDHGRFVDASEDFASAVKEQPTDPYSVIWLHIARAGAHAPDAEELAANASKLDLKAWPGPIVNLFLGRATREAVRQGVETSEIKARDGQRCEATFYIGEYDLSQGARAEALSVLRNAVDTCPRDFFEYGAAKVELNRLAP